MARGKAITRALGLVSIVVVSVYLGYLIGSMQPESSGHPTRLATSGFLVANLSIQPAEVQPNEIVSITVSVANTNDTWGIYSLVLKINGVKEAEQQATLDAGSSQDVRFSVTRREPGRYTVFINGLSGRFTVVAQGTKELSFMAFAKEFDIRKWEPSFR